MGEGMVAPTPVSTDSSTAVDTGHSLSMGRGFSPFPAVDEVTRAESGFNPSRTVNLMSKTSMAVEERRFSNNAELEALLDQDLCQTQQELAGSLGITQQAISKCLKVMGIIQKQGHWVLYELKPKDVKRRLFACEQLLARQRWKGFLHRIVTGDKKWIHYDNPKRRKSWGYTGHASTSTAKPNIHSSKVMVSIWWDQLDIVYYESLKSTETFTGDCYGTQLIRSRAWKDKRPQYNKRHDKVILQHDNARPHVVKVVKTYLETLKWEVLPHPPYSPDSRRCSLGLSLVSINAMASAIEEDAVDAAGAVAEGAAAAEADAVE
ncbi:Mariner Mos1 transposase [Eumeta japonica]|uniref:Mariner Mos1 transposase n=1 Tax=Eumeta variegata TaxID=151549 RepID=A0A4C1T1G2_EUMVA|nr:Mariner Mos1 transposase [Eumeta japonica]